MRKVLECPLCGEKTPYEFSFDDCDIEAGDELVLQFNCCKCHGTWWAELKFHIGRILYAKT